MTVVAIGDENDFSIENNLDCKFIPLETTETNLISGIQTVQIYEHRIFILNIKNTAVLVFGLSGNFITQVGCSGEGPEDYLQPCAFHIDPKKQLITIADRGLVKLLHYRLSDYQYISGQKVDSFQECAWLSAGDIAWVQSAGFDTDKRKPYYVKITDAELNEKKQLLPADFSVQYGVSAGSLFYEYDGEVYLNLPFLPTVYHITSEQADEHFKFDLGSHKFAALEWLKEKAVDNYGGAIIPSDYISACSVRETDDYMSACFYVKGANGYIGFFNKKTKQSCKYSATDFLKQSGLTGFGLIKGVYGDYFIADIFPSALKRSSIKRDDLRTVAETVSEEDNPVLCLFKFKE